VENNANVSSAKRKMEAELEQTREQLKDVEDQVQMVSGGGGDIMWWRGCCIIHPAWLSLCVRMGVVWSGCNM